MNQRTAVEFSREAIPQTRILADQAFSRAAGAPLVPGNSVRILEDAKENYPAWLEAIASAARFIHFESFIIHEDDIGHQFGEALASKARAGVQIRLLDLLLGSLRLCFRRKSDFQTFRNYAAGYVHR